MHSTDRARSQENRPRQPFRRTDPHKTKAATNNRAVAAYLDRCRNVAPGHPKERRRHFSRVGCKRPQIPILRILSSPGASGKQTLPRRQAEPDERQTDALGSRLEGGGSRGAGCPARRPEDLTRCDRHRVAVTSAAKARPAASQPDRKDWANVLTTKQTVKPSAIGSNTDKAVHFTLPVSL